MSEQKRRPDGISETGDVLPRDDAADEAKLAQERHAEAMQLRRYCREMAAKLAEYQVYFDNVTTDNWLPLRDANLHQAWLRLQESMFWLEQFFQRKDDLDV